MSKDSKEHDWKYKIVILTYSYGKLNCKSEHFFYDEAIQDVRALAKTQLTENRKVFIVDHTGIIYDSRKDNSK